MRLHLDTDIGDGPGDNPDDLAALTLAAAAPGAELVAVTTVGDADGGRAALAGRALRLLGRTPVPVRPGPATDRLAASVASGATLVAIGPLTNLAALERERPGTLADARVVVMGGSWRTPAPGLPPWGPQRDTNVVHDPGAADVVFGTAGELTLVTLADTLLVPLRTAHLAQLRDAGPAGELLADQAEGFARRRGHAGLGAAYPGLPADLVLFLHDPLAVAVALGWDGVVLQRRQWRGRAVHVVAEVRGDLPGFVLAAYTRAH